MLRASMEEHFDPITIRDYSDYQSAKGHVARYFLAALVPGLGIYRWIQYKRRPLAPDHSNQWIQPLLDGKGMFRCPLCGQRQRATKTECLTCKAQFEKTPAPNREPAPAKGSVAANAPGGQENAHRLVTPKIEGAQCYCPLCEAKQLTGRKYCFKCGANFIAAAVKREE